MLIFKGDSFSWIFECEVKMIHQEDTGMQREMAKVAFRRGIWSYILKMDIHLRKYALRANSLANEVNALSLAHKVHLLNPLNFLLILLFCLWHLQLSLSQFCCCCCCFLFLFFFLDTNHICREGCILVQDSKRKWGVFCVLKVGILVKLWVMEWVIVTILAVKLSRELSHLVTKLRNCKSLRLSITVFQNWRWDTKALRGQDFLAL